MRARSGVRTQPRRPYLLLSDYAPQNVPAGSSIQHAINEAWNLGADLIVDTVPGRRPAPYLSNRKLVLPGGWTDGTNFRGRMGRLIGEGWGEFNYDDDFNGSLTETPVGGLSGSVIKAGPSFTRGTTLLEIGPANWGTVVEGVGFLGNNRAARLVHNGSGRVTVRDCGFGDLDTTGVEHTDGLGSWCLLGAPITTAGHGGTVIGLGTNSEGFLHSHYENLRMSPCTADTQLNLDGEGGGFALMDSGGYYPTDCVVRSLYVATLRNKGGLTATGIGCLLRGCGGTSLHEYHVTSVNNAADADSNYVGLSLDAGNMRISNIYLDTQPLTLSHGQGSAYLRFENGASRCVVSDVTIIFPSSWPAGQLDAGAGLFNVEGSTRGNMVHGVSVTNDDFIAAASAPDHLVRLYNTPSSTTGGAGDDFNFLIDGVVSEGVPFDTGSYATAFGIHNNIGTHTPTGTVQDGETTWVDVDGTPRLRWRNVIAPVT